MLATDIETSLIEAKRLMDRRHMDLGFSDATAVVTGGTKGMGRAIADRTILFHVGDDEVGLRCLDAGNKVAPLARAPIAILLCARNIRRCG